MKRRASQQGPRTRPTTKKLELEKNWVGQTVMAPDPCHPRAGERRGGGLVLTERKQHGEFRNSLISKISTQGERQSEGKKQRKKKHRRWG